MPAGTITTTRTEPPFALLWRFWMLPVLAAIAAALAADAAMVLAPLVAPVGGTRLGSARAWLSTLGLVLPGAALRVALPATALCGILFLLRTHTPPVRHDSKLGLALGVAWVGALLVMVPPRGAAPSRITVDAAGHVQPASSPDAAGEWPPFGPAYAVHAEALAALVAATFASRRWRNRP